MVSPHSLEDDEDLNTSALEDTGMNDDLGCGGGRDHDGLHISGDDETMVELEHVQTTKIEGVGVLSGVSLNMGDALRLPEDEICDIDWRDAADALHCEGPLGELDLARYIEWN